MFAGDTELAKARLAEALEHPDPWVRATALLMRAHLAENMGDQVHMRADLERAAAGFRDARRRLGARDDALLAGRAR